MKKLILCALVLANFKAFSQETAASTGNTQVVNKVINYSDQPLNIDGTVPEVPEAEVSDGELDYINKELNKQKTTLKLNKEKTKKYKKLTNTTEKLVDSTEAYVDERKTSESAIKEYNKQIKCLLEENYDDPDCDDDKKKDEVKVIQAAPVEQPVAPVIINQVPALDSEVKLQGFSMTPMLGTKIYDGNNLNGIESNINIGARLESEVWPQIAIGIGFNYHDIDVVDYNNFGNGFGNFFNSYNNFYNGREINVTSMGVDLYGKFYLFQTRFRPYVGAGIGFQRLNFQYTNNDRQLFGAYNFGNEEFSSNVISGQLLLGGEFSFTQRIGAVFELAYSTGISTFGETNQNFYQLDQQRLGSLNDDFVNANALSLSMGLSIQF
jgi:hypothetical protein